MLNALPIVTLAVLAVLAMAIPASAQDQPEDDASTKPAAEQPDFKNMSRRAHTLGELRYDTVAAELEMKDDQGKTRGTIFFTHYTATDSSGKPLHEDSDRPITYVFNGGPGAASVWLHLGTAGPYRVDLPDDGVPHAPPHKVVENEASWLPFTDLVFIDPVGTGFSRAAIKDNDGDGKPDKKDNPGDEGKMFYGVREDIRWVGEFIRIHCTRFERWGDPKYLAGESYGTTRAAQLAISLHDRFGMDMSGVILISTVLDFATIREAENNPLTHVAFMPTFATVAAYHGANDMSPHEAAEAAAAWASSEYLPALMMGARLPEEKKQEVAEQYAKFTGLPVDYVLKSDLRVGAFRFMKQFKDADRQVVGRMDGRITGYQEDWAGDSPTTDPSLTGYMGVYAAAYNDYIRRDLGFESDLAYEVLSGRVHPWNSTPESTRAYSGGYLSVADDLQRAMNRVPGLRLFVANGIYDLATPFNGADYTVDQMKLSPEARERIVQEYYGGGHMMYHVAEERVQLGEDLAEFIK